MIKVTRWEHLFLCYCLFLWVVRYLFSLFNLGDALFRVSPNEPIINFFTLFWTNFWYVPCFFVLILNLILSFTVKFSYFYIIFFILYTYETLDLHITSWCTLTLCSLELTPNFLLLNSINKYHPLIFYWSVVSFLVLFINLTALKWRPKKKWTNPLSNYFIKFFSIQIFYYCWVALYLGSWWAFQEGTWGGWWNWDSSETFGLFLLLSSIRWMHLQTNTNILFKLFYSTRFFFFFQVVVYYMMQLNFDLISHNFGLKFFFFFNGAFFMLKLLNLSFLHFTQLLYSYNYNFFSLSVLEKRLNFVMPRKFLNSWTSVLLFYYFFIASFGSVISYFFWMYGNLNIFTNFGPSNLVKINAVFFVFLLNLASYKAHLSYYFLIIFCIASDPSLLIAVLLVFRKKFHHLHFLLLLFVTVNLQTFKLQLTSTALYSTFIPCWTYVNSNWLFNTTTILNDIHFFTVLSSYTRTNLDIVTQYILTICTVLPFFGFLMNSFNLNTILLVCDFFCLYIITIENSPLSILSIWLLYGFFYITRVLFFKKHFYTF